MSKITKVVARQVFDSRGNPTIESEVYLKVIRNTLAKKALSETKFSCLDKLLVGPTILAFSLGDPASAAKIVNDFKKTNSIFINFDHNLLDDY